jgi:hypothetical protein
VLNITPQWGIFLEENYEPSNKPLGISDHPFTTNRADPTGINITNKYPFRPLASSSSISEALLMSAPHL